MVSRAPIVIYLIIMYYYEVYYYGLYQYYLQSPSAETVNKRGTKQSKELRFLSDTGVLKGPMILRCVKKAISY